MVVPAGGFSASFDASLGFVGAQEAEREATEVVSAMCVPQVILSAKGSHLRVKPKSPLTWLPCRVFMIGHALTICAGVRLAADEVGEEMIDLAAFDDAHAASALGARPP